MYSTVGRYLKFNLIDKAKKIKEWDHMSVLIFGASNNHKQNVQQNLIVTVIYHNTDNK